MTNSGFTVGTTATSVTIASLPSHGVRFVVDPAAPGTVFYAFAGTLTADYGQATSGFPVAPGVEDLIPVSHFKRLAEGGQANDYVVWFRATAAGCRVNYSAE